jgi:Mrp family chromosome partitioning ATPase
MRGSFVARNLALAMTFDQSKNALLIDCNLRQPSQHTSMKIDTSRGGLINYLEDPEAEVESMLYSTGIPRLKLIPADARPTARWRLSISHRSACACCWIPCAAVIRTLHLPGQPPTLGAPDARMLSELADVVILVAGYAQNTPADIAAAAANFDPRKFAGVVFNENA